MNNDNPSRSAKCESPHFYELEGRSTVPLIHFKLGSIHLEIEVGRRPCVGKIDGKRVTSASDAAVVLQKLLQIAKASRDDDCAVGVDQSYDANADGDFAHALMQRAEQTRQYREAKLRKVDGQLFVIVQVLACLAFVVKGA